jgi:hypothetical protein
MTMIVASFCRPRRLLRRLPLLGLAVAVAGAPAPVSAQVASTSTPAPPPAAGSFPSCILTKSAISALTASLKNKPANIKTPTPVIDYVVVYTNTNPNHGQAVPGGYTGPVLCINQERVTVADTASDGPISGIDIIETDQSLQVQYGPAGSGEPNSTLVCAAYADVDKCKTVTDQ